MINKVKIDDCVLCGNCFDKCPKQCITFSKKYCSFSYPEIDMDKCIKCNLCERVCPAIQEQERKVPDQYFGVKNRDEKILKLSSSGGVFFAIAKKIIKNGGVVVGATFDENIRVTHQMVDRVEDLKKLCGSKYVQSDIKNVFADMKKALLQQKKILFVGCPCQTASVKAYFASDIKNIYLMDFICHGIVSAEIFEEYKRYLEKKYRSPIKSFEFRNKKDGWLFSGPSVEFENGKRYSSPLSKDLYMQGYFSNLNLKESCYKCKFKNYKSESDITVGDFWGVEKIYPEFYEYYGNSIVIINTEKGSRIFEDCSDEFVIKEIDEEDILKYNGGLKKPFAMSEERAEYFDRAKKIGYIKPLEKYLYGSGLKNLKNKIKRLLER